MTFSASGKGLNILSTGLPQMGGVLDSWLIKLTFYVVTTTIKRHRVVEERQEVSFSGVWQPLSSTKIQRKPERLHAFDWFICHTKTDIGLKHDDVIIYKSKQYRVDSVGKYDDYGYFYYELVEDFEGNGPYEKPEEENGN